MAFQYTPLYRRNSAKAPIILSLSHSPDLETNKTHSQSLRSGPNDRTYLPLPLFFVPPPSFLSPSIAMLAFIIWPSICRSLSELVFFPSFCKAKTAIRKSVDLTRRISMRHSYLENGLVGGKNIALFDYQLVVSML